MAEVREYGHIDRKCVSDISYRIRKQGQEVFLVKEGM